MDYTCIDWSEASVMLSLTFYWRGKLYIVCDCVTWTTHSCFRYVNSKRCSALHPLSSYPAGGSLLCTRVIPYSHTEAASGLWRRGVIWASLQSLERSRRSGDGRHAGVNRVADEAIFASLLLFFIRVLCEMWMPGKRLEKEFSGEAKRFPVPTASSYKEISGKIKHRSLQLN